MRIHKVPLPAMMVVNKYLPADYTDTFEVSVAIFGCSADDMRIAFWTDQPAWVSWLMRWRDTVVQLFGLQASEGDPQKLADCIRQRGILPVCICFG